MQHISIMVPEVLALVPLSVQNIVDGTTWHGGHTLAMAEQFPDAKIVAMDRDAAMLQHARERCVDVDRITFVNDSYANFAQYNPLVDFILLDIGVNREHFEDRSRWFSIHDDGPLDMRFDRTQEKTAASVLQSYSVDELTRIFVDYADFTPEKSHELALGIVKQRLKEKFTTTQGLRHFFWQFGIGKGATTVLFQALRIEVNDELGELRRFLETFISSLSLGGRCAIITFHSIEDRMVKKAFADLAAWSWFALVHKKPIKPTRQEVQKNRASRSALLRCIEKIV